MWVETVEKSVVKRGKVLDQTTKGGREGIVNV